MKFRSEEAFQRAVIDLARMSGWKVHHDRADMRTHTEGDPGFFDLVLARRGVVLIRELKNTLGTLSPAQRGWQKELGGQGVVWRPEDWDDIVEALTGRRPGHVL